jgi:hypothetical protein
LAGLGALLEQEAPREPEAGMLQEVRALWLP